MHLVRLFGSVRSVVLCVQCTPVEAWRSTSSPMQKATKAWAWPTNKDALQRAHCSAHERHVRIGSGRDGGKHVCAYKHQGFKEAHVVGYNNGSFCL